MAAPQEIAAPLFEAFVPGNPVPFRWAGHGKGRYVPAPQRAWMTAITWQVRARLRGQLPLDGPLVLDATFYLPRPKRGKHVHPIGKPDRTNLLKLAEDALTDAGLWADDALVVGGASWKVYADDMPPGVAIRVFRYTGGET